jgi:DNA mismatch endonuclease (patch repair protein)
MSPMSRLGSAGGTGSPPAATNDGRLVVPPSPASSDPGIARSMRGNKRRDTSPEIRLRSALHRLGWRFRIDLPIEAGAGRRPRPDIVFTRARLAIFIDGCFWHSCPEHGRRPNSNWYYWGPKLERNVQRDLEDVRRLDAAGWSVLRVWEHFAVEDAVPLVEAALAALTTATREARGPGGASRIAPCGEAEGASLRG